MLDSKYMVKLSSIGEPEVYPGGDVVRVFYDHGYYAWTMISYSYVK